MTDSTHRTIETAFQNPLRSRSASTPLPRWTPFAATVAQVASVTDD